MDYTRLYQFALLMILTGIVVGIGVVVLDEFGDAAYMDKTMPNETFVYPKLNNTVSLTNGNITSFTRIENVSRDVVPSTEYVVNLSLGTVNNTLNATTCMSGDTCYAWYEFREYTTTGATATDATRDAVATIGTTWMSLIITVGVLAIILGLVIGGFAVYRGRRGR